MAKGRFKHVSNTTTTTTKKVETFEQCFRELPYDERSTLKHGVGVVSTEHTPSPLLMTLLFDDKAVQHAAMSRIEAFYESGDGGGGGGDRQFLTLEQAKEKRICLHYEAFNCPISIVVQWLDAMKTFYNKENDEELFWTPYVNAAEAVLLRHLIDRQCIAMAVVEHVTPPPPPSPSPQYLITVLSSQARTSLAHEQLHFLYFASAEYREQVRSSYETLTSKTRKIIETDLAMRKYAEHVWPDEFQAYVSENAGEFGAKTTVECTPIRNHLRSVQHKAWRELI